MRRVLLLVLLLALPAGLVRAAEDELLAHDEKTLKDEGLPTEGPALVAYLRSITLSEEERARLGDQVPRLGARSFREREKAYQALVGAGRAALPLLRAAVDSPDLEVRRRAERAVAELEQGTVVARLGAAARVLAARRAAGALEALLGYLPSVDDETVEDAFREAIARLGVAGPRVDPALQTALADREPTRRAVAAFVHGRAEPPQLKPLTPLLRDPDPRVRLHAAEALVHGRDRAGVPVLIALLAEGPVQFAWRIEDLLFRLSGEDGPRVSLGAGDAETRRKSRDAWEAWWKARADRTDLARINLDDTTRGLTLYCEFDGAAGGGRVWLAGADGKSRWEIGGLNGPNDARLLPGGRVLIAERGSNRVTERDQSGKVYWEKRVDAGVIAAHRLPGGNTLITSWSQVLEVAPDGRTVWSYTHPAGFRYAYRERNGRTVGISASGQVVVLDGTGKLVRQVTPAQHTSGAGYWATVEALPGGRYLAALGTSRRVVEIDDTGRIVWDAEVPNVVFATRLRNGNTLACNFEERQVVEIDRAGKVVSKVTLTGRPFSARRY